MSVQSVTSLLPKRQISNNKARGDSRENTSASRLYYFLFFLWSIFKQSMSRAKPLLGGDGAQVPTY